MIDTTNNTGNGLSGSWLKPAAALAEVVVAFTATHVLYRAIKRFTVVGEWEAAAGTNFTPGAVMVAVTLFALLIGRRRFESYGLSLRQWSSNLNLGLALGAAGIAVGAVALGVTGFGYDPSRPPDPHRPPQLARIIGLPAVGLLVLLSLLALIRRMRSGLTVPPAVGWTILAVLLAVPPVLAACLHRPPVWPEVLWSFLAAGFGEEIFFRGYLQGRADAGFGRPWRILGCDVGPGLLVSSFLFGVIHVLNPVDYFEGRWIFNWWSGLQNLFEGFLYGYLRARTESVWAGAVAHGLLDAYVTVPGLLRGE
jgi:membrane protease YdiL (CAAX protease family)